MTPLSRQLILLLKISTMMSADYLLVPVGNYFELSLSERCPIRDGNLLQQRTSHDALCSSCAKAELTVTALLHKPTTSQRLRSIVRSIRQALHGRKQPHAGVWLMRVWLELFPIPDDYKKRSTSPPESCKSKRDLRFASLGK